ncbi:trypsin-like peptidase domain-containing protein [Okibacterium endophyticum]
MTENPHHEADPIEPGQAQPDQARPEQAQPNQAQPDQAQPEQAQPEQAQPDQARPDQAQPGQAPNQANQAQPEQAQAEQLQPEQPLSESAQPRQPVPPAGEQTTHTQTPPPEGQGETPAHPYRAQQHGDSYTSAHQHVTGHTTGTAFGVTQPGAPVYPYASSSDTHQHEAGQPGLHAAEHGTGEKKRRTGGRLLIAGLAIGALVGGAAGAGTSALITTGSGSSVVSESNGPASITINDTDDVTPTSAVAAKAAPSVVTLMVSSGETAGSGSGVILSEDGYVLTNNHVVTLDGLLSDPDIQVTDNAGNIYSATIVGTDPVYDLAVIKLDDASDLTPIEFADSSELNVGDMAVAIGAPLGLSGTVTDGIVSALNRSITISSSAVPDDGGDTDPNEQEESPFDFNIPGQEEQTEPTTTIALSVIQTDAAINHGNSGGALVDEEGKLIGINVAIAGSGSDEQSGNIGVGFAITSNIAERVASALIESGEATHGLLGATVTDATAAADSPVVGALIDSVTPGGAAEAAGLRAGDIVTGLNELPITGSADLTAQVRALAAGESAELTFVRDSESHTVDVTLGTLVL